jgi:hypothetical protein
MEGRDGKPGKEKRGENFSTPRSLGTLSMMRK